MSAGFICGKHRDELFVAKALLEIVAAGAKVTAFWALMGQWKIAWNSDKRARVFVRSRKRDRPEKRLRIGVLHVVEHRFDIAAFDSFARVHDTDTVACFENEAEVVRYEQHRGAVFFAKILYKFHNSRFHSYVKRSGWLIEDEQGRL